MQFLFVALFIAIGAVCAMALSDSRLLVRCAAMVGMMVAAIYAAICIMQ